MKRFFLILCIISLSLFKTSLVLAQGINFIRDTEIENAVRVFSRPLYQAAGLNSRAIQVYIIQDHNFNAFVAGGKRMFINTGMLIQTNSPEQIQGVIAHELGHITGGHQVRMKQDLENAKAKMIAAMILGIPAAAVAGGGKGAIASSDFGRLLGERLALGYMRSYENSADQAALQYLDKAKISARGMLETFKILEKQGALYGGGNNPYTRTHPLSQNRIGAVIHHLQTHHSYPKESKALYDLQKRIKAKLIGYTQPLSLVLRQYKPSDTSIPSVYAQAIAYKQARDMKKALTLTDILLKKRPQDAYFMELKADILRDSTQLNKAIPEYKKVLKIYPWAALIRMSLAQVLIETNKLNNVKEAVRQLNIAVRYEPKNVTLWRLFMGAYGKLGNKGMIALSRAKYASLVGRQKEAYHFSQKAQKILPRGSTKWLQADDISHFNKPHKK